MYRTLCVLAVVALYVGVAHSWDFAVSSGDQLIFYTDNGTETDTIHFKFQNLGGLAYDVVHNRMLYVDKQNNNDTICGYNLCSKEKECFIERSGRNILSIAYDPATEKLFFTDANEKSINWISLKRRYLNNIKEHLLIKMDDRTPDDIAVDSCGGYIYWSKTEHLADIDMERARFDGSGREALYDELQGLNVISLTIDTQTQKISYFDDAGYMNTAEYMNERHEVPLGLSNSAVAKELTVSKDYFYFMTATPGESGKSLWRFPKNASSDEEPKKLRKFDTDCSFSIATNYKIHDQIKGLQDCDSLSNLISTITEEPGTTCERYAMQTKVHTDICVNYCLHGNCSVNDEGLPKCSCNVGYTGERCEVSVCHGYCLNGGECSLNEEEDPVCQCAGNHEGARCEADVTDTTPTYDLAKRNLTVTDLLSILGKHSSRMFVTFEVQP